MNNDTPTASPSPELFPAATAPEAPAAAQAAEHPAAPADPTAPGAVDKHGRPYDPAKFLPEFDRAGRWKNRNAGRGGKAKAAQVAPPPAPAPDLSDIDRAAQAAPAASIDPEGEASRAGADLQANPTAETIIGAVQVALVLIGQEEGILSESEREMLRRPLLRVLKKYEVAGDALPEDVDLILTVIGLIIARLRKPKTAGFFAKVRHAVGEWWMGLQGRRLAARVTAATS